MPEYNGNHPNVPRQGQAPAPRQGQPYRPQQQGGVNGQIRRPVQNQRPSQPSIRQVSSSQRRPNPSGYRQPKRRRKPTPFLIIFIVFIIILLIVIFTSKSFRGFIDGLGKDTETETADTSDAPETKDTEEQTTEEVTTEAESTVAVAPPEDDEFLICIDPGHGFGDGGTSSELLGELLEKDINLLVAKQVYDMLKTAGYNVILSHDGESFPKAPIDDGDALFYIDERVSYVNSKKVDLFVSVHCDSFGSDPDVYGTRIYYCSSNAYSEQSSVLADTVKRAVNEAFPNYKESRVFPKEGGSAYQVTRDTKAPAVLIELGFVTNPDDAARMLDEEWREDMAYAIANAVSVYLHESNTETE